MYLFVLHEEVLSLASTHYFESGKQFVGVTNTYESQTTTKVHNIQGLLMILS